MEELQEQVNKLREEVDSLKNSTTIPKVIGDAMTVRVLGTAPKISQSSTATTAYIQAVNEAGSATYNVSKPMVGFISITLNGTSYIVPYF